MKTKLLIGTIVVLGIAAAIFKPMLIGFALIGFCIYLVRMIWNKKTILFHDQVEPKIAERRYKMLKTFLLVAIISFVVFIVGIIVNIALYYPSEVEEPVSFVIAYSAIGVFVIATIGSLVILLKGRRKTT